MSLQRLLSLAHFIFLIISLYISVLHYPICNSTLCLIARSIADESPLKLPAIRIDDDSHDSFEVQKTIRATKLARIAWHEHVHKCKKVLGLTSGETPQSIVEEIVFEDDDLGFLGEDDESTSVEAVRERAMAKDGAEDEDLSELDPRTVEMMRILLQCYFDLYRSVR
ncbi:hypothetical protein OROMI_028784 [Orobanche minor]